MQLPHSVGYKGFRNYLIFCFVHCFQIKRFSLKPSVPVLLQLKYKNMDGSRFVSLYDVAIWQFAYHYLLAFLQMAVVLKFLKLLRFIKRLLTLQMVGGYVRLFCTRPIPQLNLNGKSFNNLSSSASCLGFKTELVVVYQPNHGSEKSQYFTNIFNLASLFKSISLTTVQF